MATQGFQGAGGREQFVNRRYRVVRQLGVGGMGAVYLVEDTLDENQLVALKTIRTGAGSPFALSAFRQEFRAMTQFHHPNVVEVYEFGNLNAGEDFFTMEVVEGKNLLEATARAPLAEIYDYAIQIGRALEYIHSQGFVHFDLKPDNIMVRTGGTVKVMDFGLVEDIKALQQGMVKGSVHYIAPEMVRGTAIDHRFDLYSLGAVLFHVFAGRPLYEGSATQVMHQHANGEPDFERDVRRPFPPELRRLLSRLLAKEPADRLPSASAFLVEMARIAGAPGPAAAAREVSQSWVLGSRFVGREAELGHLKAAFVQRVETVVPGAPPLQLVAGPAGMGRSRLLQELRHFVQLRGVRFAHGSSLEEGGLPALPFSEVLRALVREILPPEQGEELASFRDALRVPFVAGESVPARGPTMATLPPSAGVTTSSRSAPTLEHLTRHVELAGALSPTVARTVMVTPEARRTLEGETEVSNSLGVMWSGRPLPGVTVSEAVLQERADRLRAALLRVLEPAAAALSRLLPDQPALRRIGAAAPSFSTAKAERAWLVDRLSRFLVDAARLRPLVLYLSDLHWADELTLEVLERVARDLVAAGHDTGRAEEGAGGEPLGPSRFLLLACFRDDELAEQGALRRALSGWTQAGLAEVTTLPAMGPAELTQMLHSMLGPVSLPVTQARLLLERTGGNPFLIEATVRELLEDGRIRREGDAFALAEDALDAGEAPGTIDTILDRMLARLDPRERTTLRLLAVFNRPTSALSLQMAAPDLDHLPRLLATLQRKRLLQRGWAEGHYQYRLRHNQLRAHIYRGLTPVEQQRLHAAVGRVIEARHGQRERYFEDLALHFQRAGYPEGTLRYARAAATAARRLHDLRRAASLYLTAYQALARLPTEVSPPPVRARTEAELALELELAAGAQDDLSRAPPFTVLGRVCAADALLRLGDLDGASAAIDETVRVVEAGERWGESGLYVVAARLAAARGDAASARASFDKAIEVALAQKSLLFEGTARFALGLHLLGCGDLVGGRESIERARSLFEGCGMDWYAERATRALASEPVDPCP